MRTALPFSTTIPEKEDNGIAASLKGLRSSLVSLSSLQSKDTTASTCYGETGGSPKSAQRERVSPAYAPHREWGAAASDLSPRFGIEDTHDEDAAHPDHSDAFSGHRRESTGRLLHPHAQPAGQSYGHDARNPVDSDSPPAPMAAETGSQYSSITDRLRALQSGFETTRCVPSSLKNSLYDRRTSFPNSWMRSGPPAPTRSGDNSFSFNENRLNRVTAGTTSQHPVELMSRRSWNSPLEQEMPTLEPTEKGVVGTSLTERRHTMRPYKHARRGEAGGRAPADGTSEVKNSEKLRGDTVSGATRTETLRGSPQSLLYKTPAFPLRSPMDMVAPEKSPFASRFSNHPLLQKRILDPGESLHGNPSASMLLSPGVSATDFVLPPRALVPRHIPTAFSWAAQQTAANFGAAGAADVQRSSFDSLYGRHANGHMKGGAFLDLCSNTSTTAETLAGHREEEEEEEEEEEGDGEEEPNASSPHDSDELLVSDELPAQSRDEAEKAEMPVASQQHRFESDSDEESCAAAKEEAEEKRNSVSSKCQSRSSEASQDDKHLMLEIKALKEMVTCLVHKQQEAAAVQNDMSAMGRSVDGMDTTRQHILSDAEGEEDTGVFENVSVDPATKEAEEDTEYPETPVVPRRLSLMSHRSQRDREDVAVSVKTTTATKQVPSIPPPRAKWTASQTESLAHVERANTPPRVPRIKEKSCSLAEQKEAKLTSGSETEDRPESGTQCCLEKAARIHKRMSPKVQSQSKVGRRPLVSSRNEPLVGRGNDQEGSAVKLVKTKSRERGKQEGDVQREHLQQEDIACGGRMASSSPELRSDRGRSQRKAMRPYSGRVASYSEKHNGSMRYERGRTTGTAFVISTGPSCGPRKARRQKRPISPIGPEDYTFPLTLSTADIKHHNRCWKLCCEAPPTFGAVPSYVAPYEKIFPQARSGHQEGVQATAETRCIGIMSEETTHDLDAEKKHFVQTVEELEKSIERLESEKAVLVAQKSALETNTASIVEERINVVTEKEQQLRAQREEADAVIERLTSDLALLHTARDELQQVLEAQEAHMKAAHQGIDRLEDERQRLVRELTALERLDADRQDLLREKERECGTLKQQAQRSSESEEMLQNELTKTRADLQEVQEALTKMRIENARLAAEIGVCRAREAEFIGEENTKETLRDQLKHYQEQAEKCQREMRTCREELEKLHTEHRQREQEFKETTAELSLALSTERERVRDLESEIAETRESGHNSTSLETLTQLIEHNQVLEQRVQEFEEKIKQAQEEGEHNGLKTTSGEALFSQFTALQNENLTLKEKVEALTNTKELLGRDLKSTLEASRALHQKVRALQESGRLLTETEETLLRTGHKNWELHQKRQRERRARLRVHCNVQLVSAGIPSTRPLSVGVQAGIPGVILARRKTDSGGRSFVDGLKDMGLTIPESPSSTGSLRHTMRLHQNEPSTPSPRYSRSPVSAEVMTGSFLAASSGSLRAERPRGQRLEFHSRANVKTKAPAEKPWRLTRYAVDGRVRSPTATAVVKRDRSPSTWAEHQSSGFKGIEAGGCDTSYDDPKGTERGGARKVGKPLYLSSALCRRSCENMTGRTEKAVVRAPVFRRVARRRSPSVASVKAEVLGLKHGTAPPRADSAQLQPRLRVGEAADKSARSRSPSPSSHADPILQQKSGNTLPTPVNDERKRTVADPAEESDRSFEKYDFPELPKPAAATDLFRHLLEQTTQRGENMSERIREDFAQCKEGIVTNNHSTGARPPSESFCELPLITETPSHHDPHMHMPRFPTYSKTEPTWTSQMGVCDGQTVQQNAAVASADYESYRSQVCDTKMPSSQAPGSSAVKQIDIPALNLTLNRDSRSGRTGETAIPDTPEFGSSNGLPESSCNLGSRCWSEGFSDAATIARSKLQSLREQLVGEGVLA